MDNSKSNSLLNHSIHKVVSDLTTILEGNVKDLCLYEEEIKDHFDERKVDESEVRRKMKEAKEKVIGLVETFF